MRVCATRKRSVGLFGTAHTSYSTLIFTKPSPEVISPRVLPILRTHSMRKQPCVAPPTTSAVVRPDGTLLSYQPYGKRGLLIADIDTSEATGLLAARCKSF